MFAGIYSVSGVQTVYHGCCRTQRNVTVWKPKQVRIWVSTENSRGPEIRPDGGRRGTSSFHAGFRLTEEEQGQREMMKMGRKQTLKVRRKIVKKMLYHTFIFTLTGKDNKEDDGDIDEEELEVSKVTEDLRNKSTVQRLN